MKTRYSILIRMVVIFVACSISIATAQDIQKKTYAKNGIYIATTVPQIGIGGDFNGEYVLIAEDQVFAVPKVKSSTGFGVLIGYRGENFALQASRVTSSHRIAWMDAAGDASYTLYTVDSKFYSSHFKFGGIPTRLYALTGLSIPNLIVKDGSAMVSSSGAVEVADASFLGIGYNLGFGLSFDFFSRISIDGGLIYRSIRYHSVKAGDNERVRIEGEEGLGGGGLNFTIGAGFTF